MKLIDFMIDRFSNGLSLDEAINLCRCIYSCGDILPRNVTAKDLSRDCIIETFVRFDEMGYIQHVSEDISVDLCEFWNSIIDDLFKESNPLIQPEKAEDLIKRSLTTL